LLLTINIKTIFQTLVWKKLLKELLGLKETAGHAMTM